MQDGWIQQPVSKSGDSRHAQLGHSCQHPETGHTVTTSLTSLPMHFHKHSTWISNGHQGSKSTPANWQHRPYKLEPWNGRQESKEIFFGKAMVQDKDVFESKAQSVIVSNSIWHPSKVGSTLDLILRNKISNDAKKEAYTNNNPARRENEVSRFVITFKIPYIQEENPTRQLYCQWVTTLDQQGPRCPLQNYPWPPILDMPKDEYNPYSLAVCQ